MTNHSASLGDQLRTSPHPVRTTQILQEAIDRTAEKGGGLVSVPPGNWTIATLYLRSGITLRLERNATLSAHTDLRDFPTLSQGHNKDRTGYHLIVAEDCQNLTIEGDGIIDGRGEEFWEEPLRDLQARGMDISADIARAPSHWPIHGPFWRGWKPRISPLIELRNCRNLVLRDFTIRRSPGWTVHTYCCDFVRFDGLTIENHIYGPNTDGLDINGCRDVRVSNCYISGCDDNIILKATRDARSCERVVVTNCILKSVCAALGLGAETSHPIRDIAFSNCTVEMAIRMVQFQMWEASTIENVAVTNITGRAMTPTDVPMEKVVYMDIQQQRRTDPALGHIRNVVISGITATTKGRCILTAQKGAWMEDITLRDIQLFYPSIENAAELVKTDKSNQNNNYNPDARVQNSVLVAENIRNLQVHNLSARMPRASDTVPAMRGAWLRNVRGGVLDCPALSSNDPRTEPLLLHDCDVDVRRFGPTPA